MIAGTCADDSGTRRQARHIPPLAARRSGSKARQGNARRGRQKARGVFCRAARSNSRRDGGRPPSRFRPNSYFVLGLASAPGAEVAEDDSVVSDFFFL